MKNVISQTTYQIMEEDILNYSPTVLRIRTFKFVAKTQSLTERIEINFKYLFKKYKCALHIYLSSP